GEGQGGGEAVAALSIKAGAAARRLIEREGFSPDLITHLGAAAGGPKWLILDRLDRALFGEWFKARRKPLVAVGASIGSWRLACAAQRDPIAAIERFEAAYLDQRYGPKPSAQDVSAAAQRILDVLLGEHGVTEILAHPWLRLNIVAARCRAGIGSENSLRQKAGLLGALLANLVHRRALGAFFERTLLHSPQSAPVALKPDGFTTHVAPLTCGNLVPALMASASIPMVMTPVRDIPGAPPGAYLDGGMVDYHMDLPLAEPNGILFLPHFGETVTTGWLDKFLPWRKPRNLDHTLLIAPSAAFIERLPQKRIPDRHDFYRYAGHDDERIRDWRACVVAGQQLADEWMELVATGRLMERIDPL
ncbi:MAG TPA: patatin-like phospholipase family protein, partial [Nevskiales bacterium]|nr:patatin-like phospholipase family protein [Nevskiales bacterium]